MSNGVCNKSGHFRRKPSDNAVTCSAGEIEYDGNIIDYDTNSESWVLNGKHLGSLSSLSKALRLNVETHHIGFHLERKGYRFTAPFK